LAERLHYNGIGGITKDNYKAMEWFIKSYNAGEEDALEIENIVL